LLGVVVIFAVQELEWEVENCPELDRSVVLLGISWRLWWRAAEVGSHPQGTTEAPSQMVAKLAVERVSSAEGSCSNNLSDLLLPSDIKQE
jgi:hypothetical protein